MPVIDMGEPLLPAKVSSVQASAAGFSRLARTLRRWNPPGQVEPRRTSRLRELIPGA